jgi:hypothetical protein
MPGKSTLTADAAEQATLRARSKSEQRGEADRARLYRYAPRLCMCTASVAALLARLDRQLGIKPTRAA